MFARIVTLITVAAVVACPMWCGGGLCEAVDCCAAETATTDSETCTAHNPTHCCCDKSLPVEDHDCPAPEPVPSSCQGVCGGAVLEKPAELPTHDDCLCLSLTDVNGASVTLQVEHASTGDGIAPHCRGNYGRLLRALRMSFLV